jgi:hypothetical protein
LRQRGHGSRADGSPPHGHPTQIFANLPADAGLQVVAHAADATIALVAAVDGFAPGLRADLVLVTGDPTTDITAAANIAGVWRRGVRCASVGQ